MVCVCERECECVLTGGVGWGGGGRLSGSMFELVINWGGMWNTVWSSADTLADTWGEIDRGNGVIKIWKKERDGVGWGGSEQRKHNKVEGTLLERLKQGGGEKEKEREFKVCLDWVLSSPCPSSSPESRIAHLVTLNSRCSYPGERSGRGHFSSFLLTIW